MTTIVWIAMRDAAILYYFRYYVVGDVEATGRFTALATWFNVVGTIATLIGVACTNWFTVVFRDKKNAYFWLTGATAITPGAYYFSGPGDIVLIFVIQGITSFLMGPLMPLFWSMIADTADYSEWKFGRRFTGLIFSAGTFSQKAGWAVGPALAGYLLAYYGYQPNAEQTETATQGLRMMMSVIPSALGLVGAALVLFYGINLKLEKKSSPSWQIARPRKAPSM